MKKLIRALLPLTLCLLLCCTALGESITFDGKVSSSGTVEVYAPIGGTVASVEVAAGDAVEPDTVLAVMKTNKVYASEDGVVTGVMGQAGDNAETVGSRYGAVLYIEGNVRYTLSASTSYAYKSTETQYVRVGEKVYVKSRTTSSRTGSGTITAVSGTNFTVELDDGIFLLDESCEVFRESDYAAESRIGRGSIARKDPIAVTTAGSIVSIAVKDGDAVHRGELLLETLDGTFDGLYMSGTELYAGVQGVIAKLGVEQGGAIQKNAVTAVIYPRDRMYIEGTIQEADLGLISVGMPVSIELTWNQDDEVTYQGVITGISALADAKTTSQNSSDSSQSSAQSGPVTYTVYVSFTPDENTRYGMTALITTLEAEEEMPAEEEEEEPEEEEAAPGARE